MREEIVVSGGVVPLVTEGPISDASVVLVLAHGAGGSPEDPLLLGLSSRLAARGLAVVRFAFLYRALGKKLPDRMPTLETTYREVLVAVRERCSNARLVIGGKSMGGRVASHLAARGEAVAGLCLLSYPLKPPRSSKTDRVTHLGSIETPTLVVQGTRDPFGGPNEVRAVLRDGTEVLSIEGGDHDLCLPRSVAISREQILDLVALEIADWARREERVSSFSSRDG